MQIATLLVCQRQLNRPQQIAGLIHSIQQGEEIPKISLSYCEEQDAYSIRDGHHRVTAYFLAGYTSLPGWSYEIDYRPARTTFGDYAKFFNRKK